MVDNVIIMAGGAGKRLWPASFGRRPKQFMSVDGGASLLRGSLDRAFALGISGKVIIVTHEDHVDAAVEECLSLGESFRSRIIILAEPVAKNTAPALALAAARLTLDGREGEVCLVMAADHLISPMEAFADCVRRASREAAGGFIVPYGIVPEGPATGYGYIEAGEPAGEGRGVVSFREKPDAETARRYVESGRYFWNAGLFTYRTDVFSAELAAHAPEVSSAFDGASEDWFLSSRSAGIVLFAPSDELRHRYDGCPGISVDYAVMERTDRIRMVEADFSWNDVGSWDVIAGLGAPSGVPVYNRESRGNFVYSDRPVALCGVEDLIVVVANGRVLVCRKGMSQLVKGAAEDDSANS